MLQNMTRDAGILQEVKNEVLQVYIGLQGMHPVKAEIQYMKEIQMMDGYGMEYYTAKVGAILTPDGYTGVWSAECHVSVAGNLCSANTSMDDGSCYPSGGLVYKISNISH